METHARVVTRLAIAAAVGAVVVASVEACDGGGAESPSDAGTGDGSSTVDASPDARTDDAGLDASPDARADADADAGPLEPLLPCSAVTFCDDFEGPTPLPRRWRAADTFNGGTIGIEAGAGAGGTAGLVASVPGLTADLQEAILLFDADGGAAPSWRARVAFAAKVVGDGTLNGPRLLLAAEADGSDRRDVIVRFDASAAVTTASIDYFILPCAACADAPSAKVAVGGDWHRYVLDVVAKPGGSKATGHGTVRLFVDGALAIDAPLGIPLSTIKMRTLDFGITQAVDNASGTIFLDDAYFELR